VGVTRKRVKKGGGTVEKMGKKSIRRPGGRPGSPGGIRMKRGTGIVSVLAIMVLLSSCGGGGSSASTPYTGLTTAAVITDNNADEIALAAFQGGDLGANAVIPLSPDGNIAVRQPAARPTALALVQAVSKAAMIAVRPPAAAEGPSLRAPFTESGVIPDGLGGEARYTISGDDVTGVFTGTFEFVDFHGDGGGIIVGNVSVSGTVTQNSIRILFNFQSVRFQDGTEDVTAVGTVDLTVSMVQVPETGAATLNLFFTDNITLKTVWMSNVVVGNTVGTGTSDMSLSGRIYLHDYGYVDVATPIPFHYLDGSSFPSGGQMIVTGWNDHGVRLTVDSQTQYTLGVELDGDALYDELTVTLNW
jgi:hypothetical protein